MKLLSEVANTKIDEVFIGSCMTNIGHFRAVAQLLKDQSELPTELWVAPPTRMDEAQLKKEVCIKLLSRLLSIQKYPVVRCVWAIKHASKTMPP
ncbi:Aconitate hydratase 2 (EC [uncultured Gammaproteobacteria bacterium]|nr:Aconitate hydratase 2 (EC [uncultured Gammaproteobacteria bacterium]